METLSPETRKTFAAALEAICDFRGWKLWAHSVRSNQIHLVLSAEAREPKRGERSAESKSHQESERRIANLALTPSM